MSVFANTNQRRSIRARILNRTILNTSAPKCALLAHTVVEPTSERQSKLCCWPEHPRTRGPSRAHAEVPRAIADHIVRVVPTCPLYAHLAPEPEPHNTISPLDVVMVYHLVAPRAKCCSRHQMSFNRRTPSAARHAIRPPNVVQPIRDC